MKERAWGNEYRTTLVCVDSYENGVPAGAFYNAYRGEGVPFRSTVEFLLRMDEALDSMNFPQSFCAARSFGQNAAAEQGAGWSMDQKVGKKATFALKILFRQNASWQGSVSWLEGKVEQPFRSVLELLFLMNSAMEQ